MDRVLMRVAVASGKESTGKTMARKMWLKDCMPLPRHSRPLEIIYRSCWEKSARWQDTMRETGTLMNLLPLDEPGA